MTRSKLVTGVIPDAVLFNTVKAIGALDENHVADLVPLLGSATDDDKRLYALKVAMRLEPTAAHSGWLFSRYFDTCRDMGVDGPAHVAIIIEGQFEELAQFSVQVNPVLFLGIGEDGKRLLEAILEAERTFDPNMFDADGYAV